MPCSRQYSSQHALPIWTPACPTWMDKHSRIFVISKAKTAKQRVQSTLLPSRMGTAAATASSAITMSAKGQNAVDNKTSEIHHIFFLLLDKNSILTKPQHFARVFHPKFFRHFFSWNQSCQQLKSPKPQHFHDFFTQKKSTIFSGNQSWIFGQ